MHLWVMINMIQKSKYTLKNLKHDKKIYSMIYVLYLYDKLIQYFALSLIGS